VLRLEEVENPFSQTSHTWGLSPVCVLKCLLSKEGRSKHFPQYEQGNIFLLFRRDLTEFWSCFWLERRLDGGALAGEARLISSSLGVAGGDGGEARSSLQSTSTIWRDFSKFSVSSEDETPESLETDTRSSIDDGIGENDWVISLSTVFGTGCCINGSDKSNGDSVKKAEKMSMIKRRCVNYEHD
jgi:hypothetical protein